MTFIHTRSALCADCNEFSATDGPQYVPFAQLPDSFNTFPIRPTLVFSVSRLTTGIRLFGEYRPTPDRLRLAQASLAPTHMDRLFLRERPLRIDLYRGDICAGVDARMLDAINCRNSCNDEDGHANAAMTTAATTTANTSMTAMDSSLAIGAVTCIEVIEHVPPSQLEHFAHTLFAVLRKPCVIISTPNAEYNIHFPALNYDPSAKTPALRQTKFRDADHKFEWTRAEFEQWYNGESV